LTAKERQSITPDGQPGDVVIAPSGQPLLTVSPVPPGSVATTPPGHRRRGSPRSQQRSGGQFGVRHSDGHGRGHAGQRQQQLVVIEKRAPGWDSGRLSARTAAYHRKVPSRSPRA
jgi:hypothetical protein